MCILQMSVHVRAIFLFLSRFWYHINSKCIGIVVLSLVDGSLSLK